MILQTSGRSQIQGLLWYIIFKEKLIFVYVQLGLPEHLFEVPDKPIGKNIKTVEWMKLNDFEKSVSLLISRFAKDL